MKIKLRSGVEIIDSIEHLAAWKDQMMGRDGLVTYSTDIDGVIIFWASDIREIFISPEEIEASMERHDR